MIRVGGEPFGGPGDVEFCGLIYPEGDEISKHMASRLRTEPHYQHDKLKQALAITKRRRMAVDCGAWVGGWSRELAKHFQSVLAIEANPDSFRCCQKNLASQQNARAINVALGDTSGSCRIVKDNGPNVGSRVADLSLPWEQHQSVSVRILDEILWDAPHVDYIKVHVNGMELKALRGAVDTIAKHKPVLTVVLKPAIESYGASADSARAFLANNLGYRSAGGERPYELWVPK